MTERAIVRKLCVSFAKRALAKAFVLRNYAVMLYMYSSARAKRINSMFERSVCSSIGPAIVPLRQREACRG